MVRCEAGEARSPQGWRDGKIKDVDGRDEHGDDE